MINELSVEDLKEKLDRKEIQLIDVREDHEFELCSITNSIHIPMNIIPKTLHKLSKSIDYAVICHSGIRSYNVAFYLQNNGYSVFNVTGGIDRWAVVVDRNMNRY